MLNCWNVEQNKNTLVDLKGRQIISLSGVPTYLGPVLGTCPAHVVTHSSSGIRTHDLSVQAIMAYTSDCAAVCQTEFEFSKINCTEIST
jgi:hypothetical protein